MKRKYEMENVIEVKNLVKKYKELTAVDDLSFEVKKGEILGLLRTKWKRKNHNYKLCFITSEF